jgi:hypothetical protein
LQRVKWTGESVFEIKEMRARSDGFELVFTEPVDPASAARSESYSMKSYTYLYSSAYGSDEIESADLKIVSATVARDARSVHVKVDGLREFFVHELSAKGVRSGSGAQLLHADAYYTLNRIPSKR